MLVAQIFQIDAEAAAVGELAIVATLSREVGKDFNRMADVADKDEESDQRILLEQRSVPVRYGGSECGHATPLRRKDQLQFIKLIGGTYNGRASLRERVVQYVEVAVVTGHLKKK